uniref:DNA-directed RNA polymerase, mitochondrial n=1 Tax=Tetraselmis sp. GSL018 TaxID=582737 RepID=A0A061RHR9_9CHLO
MDACKRRVLHLLRNRPVLSRPGAMEPGFPVTGQATPERLLRLSSRSWVTERQQHSASSMTGAKDQPSASFDRTNASALKGFAASGSDGFLSLHEKYLRESELQRTYLDACLKAVEGNKYSSMYMTDVESVNFASVMAMESVNDTNSDRRLSPEDVYVKSKWHQQVQSEVRTAGEALQRHCLLQESALKRKDAVSIPRGRQMLNSWFPRLKERIEIEKETLMSRAKKSRRVPAHAMTSALINDLNSDQLAVITIQSVMGSMLTSSGQVMLSKIALNLGRAVQLQCNLELMRDRVRAERQNARQRQKEREARQSEALEKATKDGKDPEPLMRAFNEEERADRQHLNMRLLKWDPSKLNTPELSKSLRANLKNDMIDWDSAIVAKVGALLMKCLMDSAEVEVADTKSDKHETRMEPAFTHTIEVKQLMPGQKVSTNFRRYGMINVHPAVLSSMLEGVSVTDLNITRYRPMVIPPCRGPPTARGVTSPSSAS